MFFWNSLAFLMIQWILAIWSLLPMPFLKPAWTSGSSRFTYYWSLAWRILSITTMWDECNCAVDWAFFGIDFLWDWNENWPFPVLGHCWVFQNCWHVECSTFIASSFRIWNSSTGIQSPPLALFIVMLSKAHLTSHSRLSGSRWVITLSWLSGLCSGYPFPSPGGLPNPVIKLESPSLQADSLPAHLPGKPIISLCQTLFQVLYICYISYCCYSLYFERKKKTLHFLHIIFACLAA